MQKANKTKSVLSSAVLATVASAGLYVSAHAVATAYTFTGATGANWSDAVWNPVGTPGVGDSAVVQLAGGNLGINLTGPTTVGQLTIGTPSGSPFTTDIGNGSTANVLTLDNTGGLNNTDANPANANATIYSMGVAGSTNIISAPLAVSGAATANSSTAIVAYASTNNLALDGGIIIDNNTTLVGAGTLLGVTTGVTRTLQMNLGTNNTMTVGPITSRFSVVPTTGVASTSYNITNALQIGARADNTGTINFRGVSYGTTILNGNITNGASVVNGANTFNSLTQIILGQAGANNGFGIGTIVINGNNTYSGGARLFRANVVLGSDSALGTGGFQWGGGAASGAMGFNFFSTDDARTIANTATWQRNLTVKGSNSLTFSGVWTQSNSSSLFNLLPLAKAVTFSNRINSDNATGTAAGRLITFDGSGKTVVSGIIANNVLDDGLAGRVSKAGDGVLVLSGANTYRGLTAVNGGFLQFTNAGAIGNSASMILANGGAVGLDSGATVPFVHPTLGTITIANLIAAGTQPSTGAIALAAPDAAANIDYTTGIMSDAKVVGVSIGAALSGVTYTGTITPDATQGYRLGGGGTLTVANANAITGARSLNIVNGGTVALGANNNFTGNTAIRGTYVVGLQQAAAANIGLTAISATDPFYVPPGVYESSTLVVGSVADGASGIGNPTDTTAANLTVGGGTLRVTGSGGTSSRLFTVTPLGATIESSGSSPVVFSNTGANVSSDASTGITGNVTTGTGGNQISAVTDVSNLKVGMTVTGTGIPANATITGIRPNYNDNNGSPLAQTYTVFISANGTVAGTAVPLTFTNQDRTLTLGGSNIGDNSIAGTLADSAAGKLGITKKGAGKWILNGTNTYNGETTVSAGTLQLGRNAHAPVLTGTSGATVDTALVLDYSGGGVNPSTSVQTLLAATYAANDNFTVGQIASTAASGNRALGWVDNAGTQQVTILNTYDGDANLDGKVNTLDFNQLAGGFGAASQVWANGNFNYDANVDSLDFNLLAGTYGLVLPPAAPAGGASLGAVVPEPASLSLLVLGAAGLIRRRR